MLTAELAGALVLLSKHVMKHAELHVHAALLA
jgi:hypothetical protein